MPTLTTSCPTETERIGAALASSLEVGDVLGVRGELGAGKTTLIRGACRARRVQGRVTSPTFTVGHRYAGDPDVAHLDLYRFESMSSAEWADIEPLLEGSIAFVEWPDVAEGFLPEPRASVTLHHIDQTRREIELVTADATLVDLFESAAPTSTPRGKEDAVSG